MPNVVDFRVIQDELVTVDSAEKEFDSFELDADVQHDGRKILQFYFFAPEDVGFRLSLNETKIRELHVKAGERGTVHEVIQAGVTQNGSNTVAARAFTGSVKISDIVLFFKREV
jgi:hypothetical protein